MCVGLLYQRMRLRGWRHPEVRRQLDGKRPNHHVAALPVAAAGTGNGRRQTVNLE
jgi:hypothetical protein